jgi:hypothetical protein
VRRVEARAFPSEPDQRGKWAGLFWLHANFPNLKTENKKVKKTPNIFSQEGSTITGHYRTTESIPANKDGSVDSERAHRSCAILQLGSLSEGRGIVFGQKVFER